MAENIYVGLHRGFGFRLARMKLDAGGWRTSMLRWWLSLCQLPAAANGRYIRRAVATNSVLLARAYILTIAYRTLVETLVLSLSGSRWKLVSDPNHLIICDRRLGFSGRTSVVRMRTSATLMGCLTWSGLFGIDRQPSSGSFTEYSRDRVRVCVPPITGSRKSLHVMSRNCRDPIDVPKWSRPNRARSLFTPEGK